MMIGGGTLGVLGVGGVAYTRGSVGTRWILSVHIGVALSWRHWPCVETKARNETNGYVRSVGQRYTTGRIIGKV